MNRIRAFSDSDRDMFNAALAIAASLMNGDLARVLPTDTYLFWSPRSQSPPGPDFIPPNFHDSTNIVVVAGISPWQFIFYGGDQPFPGTTATGSCR